MQPLVTSGVVNWLVAEDQPQDLYNSEYQEMARRNLPLPPEVGTGWGEYLRLTNGMDIVRGGCSFTPEMAGRMEPIYHASGELSGPTFIFAAATTGGCSITDACIGGTFPVTSRSLLSRFCDRSDYHVTSDGGAGFELTILFISAAMMETMLGAEAANAVAGALQLTALPSVSLRPLPRPIVHLLGALPQDHYTGRLRKLHTQSKAMEFICTLAAHITAIGACQEAGAAAGKRRLIEQLHEELLHLEGRIPTLDELARQFGAPAHVLNSGFKELYGCSIISYMSGQRLDSAHAALMTTGIPMKTLAANLGYSHVNHFITAFRKKFGYSPGSLRRTEKVTASSG